MKKGKNDMFIFIVNDNSFKKEINLDDITKKYGFKDTTKLLFSNTKKSIIDKNRVIIDSKDFIILNYENQYP